MILILLVLAFAAAITAGRMGMGLPQAAWAVISVLLLAGAVGASLPPAVRAVIRAWRLRRQRHAMRTQVRITAAGLPFLAALIILIAAAVNSGNNLVYLVVAALLGALVTSGIFSTLNLAGLALDLEWPEQAFAGVPTPVRLRLGNQKRLLPSYSLRLAATSDAAGGGQPARMQAAYFAYLPARRHAAAASEITFPRRGPYSAAAFLLSSRFPFGLLDKRRRFQPAEGAAAGLSLVVYPRILPAAESLAYWAAGTAQAAAAQPGEGEELYRLRPHAPGDSLRRIYWRASAKTGVLQVREFSRAQELRWRVLFALAPGGATPEQMEKAIALCASLIWAAAESEDWIEFTGANAAPGFTAAGGSGARRDDAPEPSAPGQTGGAAWRPPPMPAAEAAHAVLRYLALVDCAAPLEPFPLPQEGGGNARLFFAHRGQARGLPASARAVFASEL